MDVIVTNLQRIPMDSGFVRGVIVEALRLQGYRRPPDVGVALVDDAYIRVLNREYRGSDYATDVLAFAMDARQAPETAAPEPAGPNDAGDARASRQLVPEGGNKSRLVLEGGRETLGDIVISVERAREQARQFKHPLRREVALLAVHGLLHLLGYDDETEADASAMWARQKELLAIILDRPAGTVRDAGRARGRGRR